MIQFDYLTLLQAAAPEMLLVLVALAVLGIDLLVVRNEQVEQRFQLTGAFAALGCLAALFWTLNIHENTNLLRGMLVSDPLTRLIQAGVLATALFTILLSVQTTFTEHVGEYFAILLLGTLGMLFMVSSEDLLTIFLSLELTSLSLYVLTAFNKHSIRSAEAALKYFFFGGMATAFTLFGLSLIYGLTGSTHFRQIADALRGQALNPLLVTAAVMTVAGFGFKVAAAPFHLWAPDAYEGAPAPSAAFIASGSKVASFYVFAKLLIVALAPAAGNAGWHSLVSGWVPLVGILACLSMILGNLAAVVQQSVKRLLAYSAIAHAGYALLGLAANSSQGVISLAYYTITYGLTVLGAFGVVQVIEGASGKATLSDFAGLGRRSPFLSLCMLVFMLSLAGIPPLAGFFGKFYLFAAALASGQRLGLLWLVILGIGMSAVSLYYYLQVLKQIYVVEAPEAPRLSIPWTSRVALLSLAALVLLLGCAPELLVGKLLDAARLAGL